MHACAAVAMHMPPSSPGTPCTQVAFSGQLGLLTWQSDVHTLPMVDEQVPERQSWN
jgi:hypothetical protein